LAIGEVPSAELGVKYPARAGAGELGIDRVHIPHLTLNAYHCALIFPPENGPNNIHLPG
jgi:hypothetical protein